MKNIIYNMGYFFKETIRMFRMNWLSYIISLICTGLILFISGMTFSGWRVSDQLVTILQNEAEISVYSELDLGTGKALELVDAIKNIDGVSDARLVGEAEAYSRMEEVLGDEAHILGLFDENPFQAYIEVRINVAEMDPVLEKIANLEGVDYVRDNKEVLERIKSILDGLMLLGYLIFAAVGITTLVIISHIIRQGIYNNKDQINTLRLLGAPGSFIGFPFVLSGLFLTLGGGVLAAGILILLINKMYIYMSGSLTFIPLPLKNELIYTVVIFILSVSFILGFFGSISGLAASKGKE